MTFLPPKTPKKVKMTTMSDEVKVIEETAEETEVSEERVRIG